MRPWTHRLACASLAFSFLLPTVVFGASKKYQVTGNVIEYNDKVIIVQKDQEKFEIDRNADTKITGELKVGAKVTVYYHMTADSAEVKKDK